MIFDALEYFGMSFSVLFFHFIIFLTVRKNKFSIFKFVVKICLFQLMYHNPDYAYIFIKTNKLIHTKTELFKFNLTSTKDIHKNLNFQKIKLSFTIYLKQFNKWSIFTFVF